jgi:5-methylcytosine-specific restriction endonuclease McrA
MATTLSKANTRARKADAWVHLTIKEHDRVVEIYHKALYLSKTTGIAWTVDHIKPLSKGGLHHPDNMQILTFKENTEKSDKLIDI